MSFFNIFTSKIARNHNHQVAPLQTYIRRPLTDRIRNAKQNTWHKSYNKKMMTIKTSSMNLVQRGSGNLGRIRGDCRPILARLSSSYKNKNLCREFKNLLENLQFNEITLGSLLVIRLSCLFDQKYMLRWEKIPCKLSSKIFIWANISFERAVVIWKIAVFA